MKLGFTGTRDTLTHFQMVNVQDFIVNHKLTEFHHGDCVGADHYAGSIALLCDCKVILHPPLEKTFRAFSMHDEEKEPLPYLARNRSIVRECDYLLAVSKTDEETVRSGTWATIRYARHTYKPVTIIFPERIKSYGKD